MWLHKAEGGNGYTHRGVEMVARGRRGRRWLWLHKAEGGNGNPHTGGEIVTRGRKGMVVVL